MALFQKSVLRNYINQLDQAKVNQAWQVFQAHFLNPTIQDNIRNSKEEQYQGEFLIDLFVNVLGYTKNPQPNFNLTTEYKNEKDSKKADGAIIINDKVIGVIELKGTNTTDLNKIETQAFGYKNNQKDCIYVITSNFEKIRFYIDNAIDHIEFNLFKLNREEFEMLYLCLHKRQIQQGIPKKIKDESIVQEADVTKKLYKDYSLFKRVLFTNLCDRNPSHNQLEVFKKTQKLLDRFLFVFFAEDRGLIPPYSVRRIVREWNTLKDLDMYVPLLNRFRQFFEYFNKGYQGKEFQIYAYNGGLFAPDNFLDSIHIDDELLYEHTVKLADYNFASEVDVNILGHIFENSLNEIDEIKAQIAGETIDKTKTKRKKDGVFYTPKYITKYIVDNTVGKLCEEQKQALQINEEEYITDKKRTKPTIKKLADKLTQYRTWLLQLTICDPACGSGAFLNQALEFLITEHRYIDELQAKLFGDIIVLTDIENSILENNLFGVDLNEESVEIAKLSLWLRTAQPNRKLNNLNNNIKCGNSLIDDPAVAGDKAFNWQQEFPTVFAKGGFDVIIGNPPYVRVQGLKENYYSHTIYYEGKYKSATGNYDIYVLFMENCHQLINNNGIVSFILPHKFLVTDFGVGIRDYFLHTSCLDEIIHFGSELIFADASTYTCITTINRRQNTFVSYKEISSNELYNANFSFHLIPYSSLNSDKWELGRFKNKNIYDKIATKSEKLGNYINIFSGIQTSADDIYIVSGEIKNDYLQIGDYKIELGILKCVLKGNDIKRYSRLRSEKFVIFPYELVNGEAIFIDEKNMEHRYPGCMKYLRDNEEKLRSREKYKMDHERWYAYVYPKNLILSNEEKLISPDITLGLNITIDAGEFCLKNGAYGIKIKDKKIFYSILATLNSKLLWFYLKSSGNVLRGNYFRFNTKYIEPFHFDTSKCNEDFYKAKILMIQQLNDNIITLSSKFLSLLQSELGLEDVSKAMQKWYELSFADFSKELKKKKIELSLAQKSEWMDFFETEKKKAQELQQQINQTDKEIDRMVYALYDLTEEEIKIVEEG